MAAKLFLTAGKKNLSGLTGLLNDQTNTTKIFGFIIFAVFLQWKLLRAHTLITHNRYFSIPITNKIR